MDSHEPSLTSPASDWHVLMEHLSRECSGVLDWDLPYSSIHPSIHPTSVHRRSTCASKEALASSLPPRAYIQPLEGSGELLDVSTEASYKEVPTLRKGTETHRTQSSEHPMHPFSLVMRGNERRPVSHC